MAYGLNPTNTPAANEPSCNMLQPYIWSTTETNRVAVLFFLSLGLDRMNLGWCIGNASSVYIYIYIYTHILTYRHLKHNIQTRLSRSCLVATQDWQAESGRLLLGCFPGNVYSWSWLHIVTNGLAWLSKLSHERLHDNCHTLPTSPNFLQYGIL